MVLLTKTNTPETEALERHSALQLAFYEDCINKLLNCRVNAPFLSGHDRVAHLKECHETLFDCLTNIHAAVALSLNAKKRSSS